MSEEFTIHDLPDSLRTAIQAEAKKFSYGDIAIVLAILTEEPSLSGHQSHDTQIFPISTRLVEPADVHQPSQTAIDVGAVVCKDCLSKDKVPYDKNKSPFAIFATSREI